MSRANKPQYNIGMKIIRSMPFERVPFPSQTRLHELAHLIEQQWYLPRPPVRLKIETLED